MMHPEDISMIDKTEYHTAISKEVISGRNPLYYVYSLMDNSQSKVPLTYASFFPHSDGSIETFVNDTTTKDDDENLEDIYFKLLQISLPLEILEEKITLYPNISSKTHQKRQREDYNNLVTKNLPFATVAFHTSNIEGIESFDHLSLAHATSFPPDNALKAVQYEIEFLLKKRQISTHVPLTYFH